MKRTFGYIHPTYICEDCGKRTRDTGRGEGDLNVCWQCYQIAELDNSLSDGDITQAERDAAVDVIKAAK